MLSEIPFESGFLSVCDQGEGPAILLLHGFPLDHTMWKHQIETFSSSHRVIAPDLRGFGRTTLPVSDKTTMAQFAHDVAYLLDELDLEQIILCGLSMGGYVAWQILKKHRERVRALILCDTRASADSPEVARGRQLMAQQVLQSGTRESLTAMRKKLFAKKTFETNQAIVEATENVMMSTTSEAIAAAQRGMAERPDMTPILATIDRPTLVLCGEHDSITPSSEMRQMAELIPEARFVLIPDAGHMAPLENPSETNKAIRSFL